MRNGSWPRHLAFFERRRPGRADCALFVYIKPQAPPPLSFLQPKASRLTPRVGRFFLNQFRLTSSSISPAGTRTRSLQYRDGIYRRQHAIRSSPVLQDLLATQPTQWTSSPPMVTGLSTGTLHYSLLPIHLLHFHYLLLRWPLRTASSHLTSA